jgi:hypothetical protein
MVPEVEMDMVALCIVDSPVVLVHTYLLMLDVTTTGDWKAKV